MNASCFLCSDTFSRLIPVAVLS